MPRAARAEVFDPTEVCVVHAVQRCVRRAFLAGIDVVSGRDFEHRREWIRRRLEVLASVFGIDVLTYAILSNHIHLVLRTRPDVVATWSDREVAQRWLQLFPGRRLDEYLGQPTENDIQALAADTKRLETIRTRLTDITWFMRSVSEPIARMANREDECTGGFWEGRFKAQRIMDEAGLLACSVYVDLNPIRAGMAKTLETSLYTSAFDRIRGLKGEEVPSVAVDVKSLTQAEAAAEIKTTSVAGRKKKIAARKRQTGKRILRDAWLAPLTINERERSTPKPSRSGVRSSDKGFLSMALTDYIKLLDWTGRQGRKDKPGKVPAQVAPILSRLGLDVGMWCDLVWNFKKYFGRNAGSPASLKEAAADSGRHWSRGQRAAQACFSDG